MFVRSFVCLFACLLVCLFACLLVCLFACLLVCLFACLLVCLFACLFVCLFVCLFAFQVIHLYLSTFMAFKDGNGKLETAQPTYYKVVCVSLSVYLYTCVRSEFESRSRLSHTLTHKILPNFNAQMFDWWVSTVK